MQALRDVLRGSLSRSLRAIPAEDRLAAAWTVACGRAMAEHGTIVGYQDGVLQVEVPDPVWFNQIASMRNSLLADLARISGLKVTALELVKKKRPARQIDASSPAQNQRPAPRRR